MLEKFLKPKREDEEGESTTRLGARAIGKESLIENPTKRKAFLLSTFIAMGLAMGGAEQVQADWKSQVFGPRGIGRAAISEANRAAGQHMREKRHQIDEEYVKQRSIIESNIRALRHSYAQEKAELTRANDQSGLKQLEQNYQSEMQKLEKLKEDNQKDWRTKIQKLRIMNEVRGEGMRVIRGW